MTIRIPLVQVGGQVQQLQSGDTILAPTATADVRTMTNGEASAALVVGAPVYISAASTVKRAQANATSTGNIMGLTFDISISAAASGQICVAGVMTATTAQWDAVTGGSGGLVFNTVYYVSPSSPGQLVSTAPSTVGQVVQAVGKALNTTDMEVNIAPSILL